MKKLTLLAAVALLAGCQPGAGPGYTLDGVLTGGEASTGMAYLQRQMPDGQMVSTDSATITDGKFSLKGHVDRPQMYTLRIDLRTDPTESVQGKVFASNFYLENSPITFEGNLKTLPGVFYDPERPLEAPVIKGSATEDFYARFRADIKPASDSLAVIDRRYWEEYTAPMMNDKEHKHDYTEVGVALVKEEARWRKELQEKTLAFIRENPSSVVAFDQLVALFSDFTVNYSGKQIDEMRSWVADAWTGTPQLAALDSIVSRIKPVALGEKYADIDVQTPDGKTVKLSSLIPEGKYVMLEFWASWCGPCRAEIPHLVRVHEKYKDFNIVSVSVDEKEADWQKAMKEERMTWTQARITGGIMGEEVKKFNITGIPMCMVLDGEGRFYRTNTRGAYLDAFLMELYGK
ncbi:thioredoxin-like domain-containing protein [Bacteroides sp. Marseille-P3684]|uniref:thioredoxin-like domain-containing protein n=1 Tax=Bacteroides sp. Marseille-P3684 TaxID=2086579 RepID=UPI000D0B910F|nr:thioredoxin-like domain-containing protein [Bacteroides sp. Marseille-P3684]